MCYIQKSALFFTRQRIIVIKCDLSSLYLVWNPLCFIFNNFLHTNKTEENERLGFFIETNKKLNFTNFMTLIQVF